MSNPGNKDHLLAEEFEQQPDSGLELQDRKESPPWQAVGRMFWIVLAVSVLGGFAGEGGAGLLLLACGAGALYVCGLTVAQLLDRRFLAALATLLAGARAVAAAGFEK